MLSLFKKKKSKDESDAPKQADNPMMDQIDLSDDALDAAMEHMPKMGMMQKFAMKRLKKMSPEKRKEVMGKAMEKMNTGDNKEKMIKEIQELRDSGQLNSKQFKIAKKRMKKEYGIEF